MGGGGSSPRATNTACGHCWRLPLRGTVSPQVKKGSKGRRRELAATPAPWGSAMCCYQLIPAQLRRFPRLSRDTSCYRLSSRARTPGTQTQRGRAELSPAPLHPDGNLPATQKSPPASPAPSSASPPGAPRAHPLLWAPEPHLFPDGFPGFPLPEGRERAGAVRIQPRSHGPWHPQLTGTESIFILWTPLTTLHPRKDLSFTFYGSKPVQQPCCSSQNPAGIIWVGTMIKPPVERGHHPCQVPVTAQGCLSQEQHRLCPLSMPWRSCRHPSPARPATLDRHTESLAARVLLDSPVSNKGSAQPVASPPPPWHSPRRSQHL